MDKRLNSKRIWTRWIPIIHVILSVICEFVAESSPKKYPYEMMQAIPGEHISFEGEQAMFFLLSKLCGICLIFVLWNLVYYMCAKKKIHIMTLLLLGTILNVILYPNNFLLEVDNLMLYANSVLYYPDYWQSIYIGVWYNACLMIFRDPLILPLVQSWLFIGGVCYLAYKCNERWGKVAGFIPYVLLMLPEVVTVCTNPYRNAVYIVLGIWYYSMLFFSVLDREKKTWKKLILWSFFSAFFGLMRSEGVLVLLVFSVACLWLWQCTKKQKMYTMISLFVFVIILGVPQKLGEQKYYGKDYQIVNYMEDLRGVLSAKEANISYPGAREDLKIINEFVPIEIVQNGGLTGFRVHNYKTLGTVNQTFKSEAEQQAFLDASGRIIKNNMDIYLYCRLKNFLISNGGSDEQILYAKVIKQDFNAIETMLQEGYTYGVNVILQKQWAQDWYLNEVRMKVYSELTNIQDTYYALLWYFRVTWMLRLFSIIMLPVFAVSLLIKEKNKENVFWALVSLTMLAQWGGIALFSPEARPVYYYPVFFFSLIWSWLLVRMIRVKEMNEKKLS